MTRTNTGQTRINFHCQNASLDALRRLATIKGTTYSELIRVAVHEYVLRQGEKILAEREAMKNIAGAK